MTKLSRSKLPDKKEGKKEDDEFCVLEVKWFSTLVMLLQVLTFPILFGNTQGYLVSLYVSKGVCLWEIDECKL